MTRHAHMLTVCLVGLLAAAAVNADDIAIEGLEYRNVRITALDGQTLKVRISGRQQAVDLGRVTKLDLTGLPQYNKACQAIAANQPAKAVVLLDEAERLLPANKAFFKPLFGARRIAALDAAGQFDRAVREYCQLVQHHAQPYFLAVAPARIPADPAMRRQALQRINRALASSKNEQVRAKLKALAEAITAAAAADHSNASSSPGTSPPATTPAPPATVPHATAAITTSRYTQILQGIQTTIQRGDPDKALELIANLFKQGALGNQAVPVPELTFLRAQAQAAKNQHMPAALNYLRVAILWPDSPNAVTALVQAGQLFRTLGDPQAARKLWTEARDKATDRKTRNQIDRLIQSVSAK